MRTLLTAVSCLVLLGISTPAFAQEDMGNPFISDAGCSNDDDCEEGEVCNDFGECEFFDAVGDMGLGGGGGGGDAGGDVGTETDSGVADAGGEKEDDGGCSTAGGSAAPAGLLLFGLVALRRRRKS